MKMLLRILKSMALLAIASPYCHADVSVPSLFSDHMVLQRDKPVRIWGWADPGETVNVKLDGMTAEIIADDSGEWKLSLPSMPAGGPHAMHISGNNDIRIEDVLIGEVWVASGQSNMEWPVGKSTNADLVTLAARRAPGIRYVQVRNRGSQSPQRETDRNWQVISPATVGDLSGVAYAFAEVLNDVLGVPVGIIENSWGASAAESWVDRDVIVNDPQLRNIHEEWLQIEAAYDPAAEEAAYAERLAEWEAKAAEFRVRGLKPPRKPGSPPDKMTGQKRPGNLWNARVLPIAPYTMRGVIWYQGEANSHPSERAAQYHHLFSTLIREWRKLWGEEFPFYWVQLADFREESEFEEEHGWAFLREAQTRTMNTVPNTGQAVTIDLGEGKDIHPREKEEVGRRLARWALNRDYGFTDLPARSPEFESWTQEDSRVIVDFKYTGSGLKTFDTEAAKGFVVRRSDGHWQVVEGKVYRDHSILIELAPGIEITAVRYAWANNPIRNLYSQDGLPVTPFRSDHD